MMIQPKRFGLKYAPTPTLALEYEEEIRGVETGQVASLYVYRGNDDDDSENKKKLMQKKLHVVELPSLTATSKLSTIMERLQQENERFLAPHVVKEDQLRRLLQRLMHHVQAASSSPESPSNHEKEEKEEKEEALEESVMEESATEHSMEASVEATKPAAATRGQFMTHDEPEHQDDKDDDHEDQEPVTKSPPQGMGDPDERAADDAKMKALKSDSDVSDEDVQSEELEYFSEDASDEDSF